MDVAAAKRPVTENARYAVTLTAALGLAATLLITSAGFAPAYQNRALHVAKETAGALVLLLVAALLVGRFARRGTLQDLLALALLSSIADIFEFPGAFTEEPETREELRLLSGDPALVIADVGASVLFLVAGAAFGRRAERETDEFQMWLGIGCTIAGIGYLNYALFPSSYTDFLYAGDLFRVAAVAVWGFGAIREISTYQAAFASAAVLEERRRVARDLHDGVAQELAFISSQLHWLRKESNDDETTTQIQQAVQRALDESRGAISALNRPLNEPLHLTLAATDEEAASRVGARLELDLDESIAVPPAWEEALPRIVREAVVNAVRHGGARTVTVHLRDADGIWLRVEDDGQGFDVTQPRPENSFGLMGMRERAESLGGQFRLSSEPGQGTSVEIVLP